MLITRYIKKTLDIFIPCSVIVNGGEHLCLVVCTDIVARRRIVITVPVDGEDPFRARHT